MMFLKPPCCDTYKNSIKHIKTKTKKQVGKALYLTPKQRHFLFFLFCRPRRSPGYGLALPAALRAVKRKAVKAHVWLVPGAGACNI
jgi:hypothetical protein